MTLASTCLLAFAVLAVTAVRIRSRWTYEWIGLATRYASRRRHWPARPTPNTQRREPAGRTRPDDQEPTILTAVSPGARIGQIDLDDQPHRPPRTVGVVTHEAGLTAVLEIEPPDAAPDAIPLPSLLALLPMAEAGESPITAQVLVEVVPAPVDTLAGSAIDQSYRGLHPLLPPARRHGWIALQAVRTTDRPGPDVDDLRAALSSAIRRTTRRLTKAGFTTHVLDPDELADTLDELALDRPHPDDGSPPSGAMVEEWSYWRTRTCAQITLAVAAWPDRAGPATAGLATAPAFDHLPDIIGVPAVLALGIRRTDRGVEVAAALRLAAATRHDVDAAAAAVEASTRGLRLRRLDGEHVHGVAATLPLGAFLR